MSAKSGVGQDAPILEDSGSTDHFIVHVLVKALQLRSKPVAAQIKVSGEQYKKHQMRLYQLELKDMQGRKHKVCAIDIQKITEISQAPKGKGKKPDKLSSGHNGWSMYSSGWHLDHYSVGTG